MHLIYHQYACLSRWPEVITGSVSYCEPPCEQKCFGLFGADHSHECLASRHAVFTSGYASRTRSRRFSSERSSGLRKMSHAARRLERIVANECTLDVTRILCHSYHKMRDEFPQYRDRRLHQFADGYRIREFQAFERQLKKRLALLEDAQSKDDLRLLPSNHFESLLGDRKGQFSIRINMQWRLCFEWSDSENRAFNIEVVDYH